MRGFLCRFRGEMDGWEERVGEIFRYQSGGGRLMSAGVDRRRFLHRDAEWLLTVSLLGDDPLFVVIGDPTLQRRQQK